MLDPDPGKGIVPQNHSYTPFPLTTDPDPDPMVIQKGTLRSGCS